MPEPINQQTIRDATVIHGAGDNVLAFREDYLLFGLLVRHGLYSPEDHAALVAAQRATDPCLPLVHLLADASGLDAGARARITELLEILANPALRKLLPDQMPEVATVIERLPPTLRLPNPAPRAHVGPQDPTKLESQPPTTPRGMVAATGQRVTSANVPLAATTLTEDDVRRIESARVHSDLVGTVVEDHVIIERLGSGAQGEVYLAKQLTLGRYVAMKRLNIPFGASADLFLAAFRREAQTLAAINHSNIVKIHNVFVLGSDAFFTMEHVNGQTLAAILDKSGGTMPLDLVCHIACQACSALDRTAAGNLIHRDIKPGNMMMDDNGDLKIVDFGLAEVAEALSGNQGGFVGTPVYASPEQCRMEPLTPASDQYSLGATLYRLLTGKLPHEGRTLGQLIDSHRHREPARPSVLNTELPPAVDEVLLRMLANRAEDRYPDFQACFNAWEQLLARSISAPVVTGRGRLLGQVLIRLGRSEGRAIKRQSLVLGGVWVAMVGGAMAGEVTLRSHGLSWLMDLCGVAGTGLMVFSLSCIFYVALARRGWLPVVGNLAVWLYTHIATIIPSVLLLMIHSGNFLRGILPGPPVAKPWLSILVSLALVAAAVSGSVGLLIYRTLRRQIAVNELGLRGQGLSPRDQMLAVLGAQLLSGWRLVHYPVAMLLIFLSILHVIVAVRYGWPG